MIIGKSVTLLPFDERFLAPTREWINRDDVRAGLGVEGPIADALHRRWYEQLLVDPTQRIFIIGEGVGRDAVAVGAIGIKRILPRYRSAEYWIYIGREDARGKRIAFQASVLLLSFAFNTLNLHRISLRVKSTNCRAIRLYEQLGFTREGIARQASFIEGHFEDMVCYSMLESEYRKLHSQPDPLE